MDWYHLDTPRSITDTAGNVVWQWDNTDPFGNNTPNENPNGGGQFSFNLRFPGQYFDTETSLNYNRFRDYDATTGRYIESDPIGLYAGVNTFAYVGGNPLKWVDPYGLYSFDDFMWDATDFSSGWGDMVSFGATSQVRELLGKNLVVNKCSGAYKGGEAFGFANSLAIGWAGGARSAVEGWANFSHSLVTRATLKKMEGALPEWLNKTGNRLNGDYIDYELHRLLDPQAYRFASREWKALNDMFPAWRQALNRIPYFPGSVAFGSGSAAMNSCECK